MKKFLSILLAVMLMLTFASLVGCKSGDGDGDGDGGADPIVGVYTQTYLEVDGVERPLPEGVTLTMEIKADGTVVMTQSYDGESQSESGTWTKDGNAVSIIIDSDTTILTAGENTLTYSEGGYVQVFTKQ